MTPVETDGCDRGKIVLISRTPVNVKVYYIY